MLPKLYNTSQAALTVPHNFLEYLIAALNSKPIFSSPTTFRPSSLTAETTANANLIVATDLTNRSIEGVDQSAEQAQTLAQYLLNWRQPVAGRSSLWQRMSSVFSWRSLAVKQLDSATEALRNLLMTRYFPTLPTIDADINHAVMALQQAAQQVSAERPWWQRMLNFFGISASSANATVAQSFLTALKPLVAQCNVDNAVVPARVTESVFDTAASSPAHSTRRIQNNFVNDVLSSVKSVFFPQPKQDILDTLRMVFDDTNLADNHEALFLYHCYRALKASDPRKKIIYQQLKNLLGDDQLSVSDLQFALIQKGLCFKTSPALEKTIREFLAKEELDKDLLPHLFEWLMGYTELSSLQQEADSVVPVGSQLYPLKYAKRSGLPMAKIVAQFSKVGQRALAELEKFGTRTNSIVATTFLSQVLVQGDKFNNDFSNLQRELQELYDRCRQQMQQSMPAVMAPYADLPITKFVATQDLHVVYTAIYFFQQLLYSQSTQALSISARDILLQHVWAEIYELLNKTCLLPDTIRSACQQDRISPADWAAHVAAPFVRFITTDGQAMAFVDAQDINKFLHWPPELLIGEDRKEWADSSVQQVQGQLQQYFFPHINPKTPVKVRTTFADLAEKSLPRNMINLELR